MTNIAFKQAHSGNYRRAARGKEDIRYLVIHFYGERRRYREK